MINKFVNYVKNMLRESYSNFPITNGCILLITLCLIFNNLIENELFMAICVFSLGSYYIETKSLSKKNNIILYIISFLISLFFYIVAVKEITPSFYNFTGKLLITYILTISIYSIYNNYKSSEKNFSQFLENIFRGILKLSFIYGIFALSVYIIILVFNYLIIDIISYNLVEDIEYLILGMYYISNMTYVLKGNNNNEGTFFKTLIRNILNPLYYIALMIVYLYIAKLFFEGTKLTNNIFYVVLWVFIIGIPLILMCSNYKENKLFDKINNCSSFIFLPLLFFQLYLFFHQLYLFGLNEEIYRWGIIIILEISYLYDSFRKRDFGNLLIISIIVIIITILAPFINIEDLTTYSQYKNLEIYKKQNTFTDIEKNKIFNAYDELFYNSKGKKYINKLNLTEADIEIIKSFNKNHNEYIDYDDYSSISVYKELDFIDISGYDKMYEVNISENNININYINKISVNYENEEVEFDFYDTYIGYYNNKENIEKYFKNNNTIYASDQYKLIITAVYIEYKNNLIYRYDLDGYLLVKELKNIDNIIEE